MGESGRCRCAHDSEWMCSGKAMGELGLLQVGGLAVGKLQVCECALTLGSSVEWLGWTQASGSCVEDRCCVCVRIYFNADQPPLPFEVDSRYCNHKNCVTVCGPVCCAGLAQPRGQMAVL
eukprot:1160264-Pelagomonas_calceolata.AAC.5